MITHGSISFVQYKHKLCFHDRNCLARTVITLQSYQLQYSTVQKLSAPRMFCFSSARDANAHMVVGLLVCQDVQCKGGDEGCSIQRGSCSFIQSCCTITTILANHPTLSMYLQLTIAISVFKTLLCSNVWALIFLKVHLAQPNFVQNR